MMITLEDVNMLLRLLIDDHIVIDALIVTAPPAPANWKNYMHYVIETYPPQ